MSQPKFATVGGDRIVVMKQEIELLNFVAILFSLSLL
jgi:hypothetical protein